MKRITKSLRETVRDLRALEPALVPVIVRRRAMPDDWGQCNLIVDRNGRPKHFVITLHPRIPECILHEMLFHEWAHAVSWQEGVAVDNHGPEWGLAHARIYQQMLAQ